ncbi:MAG: hypothetical protein CMG71_05310 [Candidatus Marinimicrobia bacterium]|nr:hypothetical protein [Candidatus Neomarinimicrobiota bacterium]|tara:strand:- start:490 stop:1416 length:927 start_codon:yes stop_codon:yes gene_type:complete
MRRFIQISILTFCFCQELLGQTTYGTVADLEEQWRKYTSYQKDELTNFCDYLFDEGHFERCIIASFRYLFLYPEDPLTPNVYYKIARSYEEQGNFQLAKDYFFKVQNEVQPNSSEFRAARYRLIYLHLMEGDLDSISTMVGTTQDPYLLTLEGFARFNNLDFEAAKGRFDQARRIFESRDHRRNLTILMRACDNARKLPNIDPVQTGLFGIFPGGGRVYLQEWIPAAGTFLSTTGLGIQLFAGGSTAIAKWIPRLTLMGVYGGSIWGSIKGIEHANTQREIRYTKRVQERYGPTLFLDFPEPIDLGVR